MEFGAEKPRPDATSSPMMKPKLIGIAGGSCTGKSWLASRLEAKLGGVAVRLSLDDFYQDRSHLPVELRARVNFDHPRSIDWDSLEGALESILGGRKTLIPQYDFNTHARHSAWRAFKPAPLVLLEGLWLYRRAELRKAFTFKIFLASPPSLCRERRLERDSSERGRDAGEIATRYDEMVSPMQERFVQPQARMADLVLTDVPTEKTVSDLAARLRGFVSPRGKYL
jgi:uridine kinase